MVYQNLPTQPTPFIGRSSEIEEVNRLLLDPNCRLLTLVGPGGIGKTRLALEAARQVTLNATCDYPDGIYFIPLQALAAPDLMVTAIADSAGFQFFQGANPRIQLIDFLANKRLLLVLDNLEHLLAGSGIISDILAHAPGVNVLATSREALNLQEEWIYSVRGMHFPAADEPGSIESFSAVRLFVQHATRINPAFSLESERAGIVRICALVGGMPLGIELAAAWVRALSCAEIADEITRSSTILETSARNVPERHRTMRGVLRQSWELLAHDEQQVMMRLAVFQGGFTREAAEAVVGLSPHGLSALVDKSWLRWDSASRRYDVHELLRQYAEEQLAASDKFDATRNAHAEFFAGWMHAREVDIKFRRQDEALAEIERDFANVRLAWGLASQQHCSRLVDQMLEALNFFSDMKARFVEGKELFEAADACFTGVDNREAQLTHFRLRMRRARMIILGTLFSHSELDAVIAELKDIVAFMESTGNQADVAFGYLMIGFGRSFQIHYTDSRPYAERSSQIYAELGDRFYLADSMVMLGVSALDLNTARSIYLDTLELQREIGDNNGIGWTLTHLARIHYMLHQFTEGDRFRQEAIAMQRARSDQKGLHFSMIMGSSIAFRHGEWEDALRMAEEGLRIASNLNAVYVRTAAMSTLGLILVITETDLKRGEVLCREALALQTVRTTSVTEVELDAYSGLAVVAHQAGAAEEARRIYMQLISYIRENWIDANTHSVVATLIPLAILVLDLEGRLEQAVELLAVNMNLSDTPGQMPGKWLEKWSLLRRLREDWRTRLGDAVYDSAWERGTQLSLEPVETFIMTGMPLEDSRVPAESAVSSLDMLTPREQEILALLAAGLSNREIAAQLVFSLGTVKWYVNQIYGKLGVGSRTQAVARARALHLLS